RVDPGVFAGQEPPSRTCAPKVPPAPVGADSWHVSTPSPKPLRPAQGACQGRDAVAGAGRIGGRDRKALSGRGDKSAPGFPCHVLRAGRKGFGRSGTSPSLSVICPEEKGEERTNTLPSPVGDPMVRGCPGPDRRIVAL